MSINIINTSRTMSIEFIVETNNDKNGSFMKAQTLSKGKYFMVDDAVKNSNAKLHKMGHDYGTLNKWSVIIVKTSKQAKNLEKADKKITDDKDIIESGGSCWYAYSNGGYLAVLHRPRTK